VPALDVRPRGWRSRVGVYLELMRWRQWIKNGFVLAGLFFSDQLFEADAVLKAVAATAAFTCLSAAVYCFNDIIDRDQDRAHPQKSGRPLARGALQTSQAVTAGILLVISAVAIVLVAQLPWQVPVVLGLYLGFNVLYSLRLRNFSLIDVILIASGFVLRLLAGTYAVGVTPSSWIVLCTGLLALFLALVKRRGDLLRETPDGRGSLSGYSLAFIDQALSMIAASTVVVYALFTVSDYAQRRFDAPLLYVTTFPVVIGMLRYLQLVVVGGDYGAAEDVIRRDRPLQLVLFTWLVLFALFVYG